MAQTNNTTPRTDVFENVFLPLPPLVEGQTQELEVYGRFMRHMRLMPISDLNIKILSAIQFTADMMDMGDALVARMLADMGLRAPRRAFPSSYLDHVDRAMIRGDSTSPHYSVICASSVDMKRFWDEIGEDKFAAFKKEFLRAEIPVRV